MLDRDSGEASAAQLSVMGKQCHFDLGDFFEMDGGISWKWDRAQRREVQKQLGPEVEEVLIRWTSKVVTPNWATLCVTQLRFATASACFTAAPEPASGSDLPSFSRGAAEQGMMWGDEKLAGPEENLMARLMETDVWRTSKWIRVSVEQEFGRWCHPTTRSDGGSDFGMCESYRWAVGIEGHRPGTASHPPA